MTGFSFQHPPQKKKLYLDPYYRLYALATGFSVFVALYNVRDKMIYVLEKQLSALIVKKSIIAELKYI